MSGSLRVRRLAVLGSSISTVVRPRHSGAPYPTLLERLLAEATRDVWVVSNLSRIAGIVDDSRDYLDRLLAERPEVVILHYGHVEAIWRPHSRAAWYRGHEIRPGASGLRDQTKVLRERWAQVKRRLMIRCQWTSPTRFERAFDQLLGYLTSELDATYLVVEANPGDRRIETWGPGSLDQIARYNDISRTVARRYEAKWISVGSFAGGDLMESIPDGTHLSGVGHERLARAITTMLVN